MRQPILITKDPRENLLSEAFRVNDIKFYRLILLSIIFIFILILTSTLVFGEVAMLGSIFLQSAPITLMQM